MAPHFDVNVIIVGKDKFTPEKLAQVDGAVGVMKTIFATFGPEVGTVRKYSISSSAAGRLVVIRSHADAKELANLWSVKNDAVDIFVVGLITDRFVGTCAVPGSCSKSRVKFGNYPRTPVVTIQEPLAESGNTFAHEVGHFLGLQHCEDDQSFCAGSPNNFLMRNSAANTGITSAQADKMKSHCAVKP
ncbi:zinc-dependent metalloprotease family protein [Streptomyces sp. NPDC001407]|uniref:zinc-dependent metalloprotease family protein n=1 Tax=unclassified Streptomyces TaxID=2593676 RepID=UPI0033D21625